VVLPVQIVVAVIAWDEGVEAASHTSKLNMQAAERNARPATQNA
jgi:hypothetical protein